MFSWHELLALSPVALCRDAGVFIARGGAHAGATQGSFSRWQLDELNRSATSHRLLTDPCEREYHEAAAPATDSQDILPCDWKRHTHIDICIYVYIEHDANILTCSQHPICAARSHGKNGRAKRNMLNIRRLLS